MSDRPTGPAEIAGVTGRIIRVGDCDLGDDAPVQTRAVGGLYEKFQTTGQFLAAVRREERQLEEDKAKLKQMTRWRRYAQRRAERQQQLWVSYRAEQDGPGFPAPMDRRRS